MLNELKALTDSLSANGIVGKTWDKDFLPIKLSSPCFVVSLFEDGQVNTIRFLPKDEVSFLRTWKGGSNGETFPAFNFTPFFQLPLQWSDKKYPHKKDIQQRLCEILETIRSENFWLAPNASVWKSDDGKEIVVCNRKLSSAGVPINNADNRAAKCLDTIERRFAEKVCPRLGQESPVFRICGIFDRVRENGADILTHFNTALLRYLGANVTFEMLGEKNSIAQILFGKEDVVLFWDVSPDIGSVLAQETSISQINAALLEDRSEFGSEASSNDSCLLDAFGERLGASDCQEKMPKVKLPGKVAETILRSMSQDIPCQTRYGLIGSASYPIASSNRMKAKTSLEWISDHTREGYTWSMVSQSEILFAYPRLLPTIPPMLARMLGNGLNAESRFSECAKRTLDALDGVTRESSEEVQIEVFAIRQADKARRKIVFYRDYTDRRLRDTVCDWIAGARNLPQITLRHWPVRDGAEAKGLHINPETFEFVAPYPLSVVPTVYRVWSCDSLSKLTPRYRYQPTSENLSLFDALVLFLDCNENLDLPQRLLAGILRNGAGLLLASKGACQRGGVLSAGTISHYVELALPIVGILLYKLSIRKEKYMNETPYMLGKVLNLADGLHRLWCECVKHNDPLPPILLGNSFYTAVSQSPNQGLASLGDRLRVYLAWAKSWQGEKAGLAHWFLKEISAACDLIHKKGIPQRMTDADKAQMLLGYMASLKSEDDAETNESESLNL